MIFFTHNEHENRYYKSYPRFKESHRPVSDDTYAQLISNIVPDEETIIGTFQYSKGKTSSNEHNVAIIIGYEQDGIVFTTKRIILIEKDTKEAHEYHSEFHVIPYNKIKSFSVNNRLVEGKKFTQLSIFISSSAYLNLRLEDSPNLNTIYKAISKCAYE